MDSGSEITTITAELYYKHFNTKLEDTTYWLNIEAANYGEVSYLGYTEIDVEVDRQMINKAGVLIVKDPTDPARLKEKREVPMVLGCNILNRLDHQSLKPELRHLTSSHKVKLNRIKVTHPSTKKEKQEMTYCFGRSGRKEGTKIPAHTEMTISVNTIQTEEPFDAIVEGHPVNLPQGIMIYPTYQTIQEGKMFVQIGNVTSQDIYIPRGQKIAKATLAEEVVPDLDMTIDPQTGRKYVNIHPTVLMREQHPSQTPPNDGPAPDIDLGDLSEFSSEQKERLLNIIKNHPSVFSKDGDDIGCTDVLEHHILTTDEVPIKQPDRRVLPQLQPAVRRHLQRWLNQGIIRESTSGYGQQLVIVMKKDGDIRLCVDFRALNEKTLKDAYPLPKVEEVLEALKGAQYYSSMDLTSGYLQLPLAEESRHKTAFRALGALYEFLRMPFGVCNGPATFSRLMSKCFGDLHLIWLIIFLDDLLIYSNTIDEMLDRLEIVFSRLQNFGLKLKPSKVKLFQREICHLGYKITKEGITTDPDKIATIRDWKTPTNDKDLHSFLGLAGYYRKFVKNFSKIAQPLYLILDTHRSKKRVKTTAQDKRNFTEKWNKECQSAFETLKTKLITAPILGFPDFELPFILEIDASFEGLGAILSQKQEGRNVVIAYASRGLKPGERNDKNYSSMRLELLGLKWAVTEKFKDYLYGSFCKVYTDNNPLSHLNTSKAACTDMRWIAQLADYNLEIHYKPGRSNQNADILSRNPNNKRGIITRQQLVKVVETYSQSTYIPPALTTSVQSIKTATVRLRSTQTSTTMPSLQQEDLAKLQDEDPTISPIKQLVMTGKKDLEQLTKDQKSLHKHLNHLVIKENILYRIIKNPVEKELLILPSCLKNKVLKALHDDAGHQGIERTTELVKSRCYWPNMSKDITSYCKKCQRCLLSKESYPKLKTTMKHLLASEPNELVCMDYTILDKASDGTENVLVITDAFTKWTVAIPTRDQTAKTVAKALLHHWLYTIGIPKRLHSDQGRNFESKIIQQLCNIFGIEKTRTTAYHPQGNSQCERYNRTLHSLLKTLGDEKKKSWPKHLPSLTFSYNITPHASTGYSPYFLLFGKHPRLQIDNYLNLPSTPGTTPSGQEETYVLEHHKILTEAHELALRKLEEKARKRKLRHGGKDHHLQPGAKVFVRKRVLGRNKIQDFWESVPYQVLQTIDSNDMVYKIKSLDGLETLKVVNRIDLLEAIESDDEDSEIDDPTESTESSSSEEEWEYIPFDLDEPETDKPDESEEEMRPPPIVQPNVRKSKRENKGRHSNPHKLPRSMAKGNKREMIGNVSHGFTELAKVMGQTFVNLYKE